MAGQRGREEEQQTHHPRRASSSPSDFSPVTSARRAQQAHLGVVQIFRRRPCVKMTLQQSTPVRPSPPRSSTENKGKFFNNVSRPYPSENCSHFQLRLHKTSPPPTPKKNPRPRSGLRLHFLEDSGDVNDARKLLRTPLRLFPKPRASMYKLRGIYLLFSSQLRQHKSVIESANDLLEQLVPRQTTLPVAQACRELHAYFQPKRFQSGGRD